MLNWIQGKEIERRVFDKKNIPNLERIIFRFWDQLQQDPTSGGVPLPDYELSPLFEKIRKRVAYFLNVPEVPAPLIVDPKLKEKTGRGDNGEVRLSPGLILEEAVPILAHEYTHVMQDRYWGVKPHHQKIKPFSEGHARGVERLIAKEFLGTLGRFCSKTNLEEIGDVYLTLRGELIFQLKPPTKTGEHFTLAGCTPRDHSIGNTYFLLLEETRGDGIYRDAIHYVQSLNEELNY